MQKLYSKKQTYFSSKSPQTGLANLARFLVIGLITSYQWTLSPDHGAASLYTIGRCKFRPTCSEYTKKCVQELGVVKGLQSGWGQIKKCR